MGKIVYEPNNGRRTDDCRNINILRILYRGGKVLQGARARAIIGYLAKLNADRRKGGGGRDIEYAYSLH